MRLIACLLVLFTSAMAFADQASVQCEARSFGAATAEAANYGRSVVLKWAKKTPVSGLVVRVAASDGASGLQYGFVMFRGNAADRPPKTAIYMTCLSATELPGALRAAFTRLQ